MTVKQRNRLVGVLLIVVGLIISFGLYCTRPKIDPRLIGTWTVTDLSGQALLFTFYPDGGGRLDWAGHSSTFCWSVKKTKSKEELIFRYDNPNQASTRPIWERMLSQLEEWVFQLQYPDRGMRHFVISVDPDEFVTSVVATHADNRKETNSWIYQRTSATSD